MGELDHLRIPSRLCRRQREAADVVEQPRSEGLRITRNKIADRLRSKYRRPTVPLDGADELPDDDDGVLAGLTLAEDRREVREALAALTPEQREVVIAKYMLGHTNAFIGEVMGRDPNAVNQLHHRALARLRVTLAARADRSEAAR